MNLIGKILTIMIFVMSAIFMTFTIFTYATHRNWREYAEGTGSPLGVVHQLDKAKQQIRQKDAEMQSLLTELASEKAARTEALAALESKVNDLQEQLQVASSENDALKSTRGQLASETSAAATEMQRLKNEVDALRSAVQKAQEDRNAKLARVSLLTDELNQRNGQIAHMEERRDELRHQLSRAKLVLDRNGLSEFTPVDNVPPDLDGVVTMVRDSNLIEVSLGSDEGIRAGNKLDIYRRDGSYIGRVIVVDTNTDRAVARIVPEYRQGVIRRGDRVATKLL